MCGLNVTQCGRRENKCLGNHDCCYECDYKAWCDDRCGDRECRMQLLRERLDIIKDMKKAPR